MLVARIGLDDPASHVDSANDFGVLSPLSPNNTRSYWYFYPHYGSYWYVTPLLLIWYVTPLLLILVLYPHDSPIAHNVVRYPS